jgi:hypothetical protein
MGIEFGFVKSRFSLSAQALNVERLRHGLNTVVPSSYINEMAAHGYKALEYYETYEALPEEAKAQLTGSSNAFVSQLTLMRGAAKSKFKISLPEFLRHFGIVKGRSYRKTELELRSICESNGISILPTLDIQVEQQVWDEIDTSKKFEPTILKRHDAEVCTYLQNDVDEGNIFATWDFSMQKILTGLPRILAGAPSRIVDVLSVTGSHSEDIGSSINLQSALIHLDEKHAESIAKKIETIKTSEQAYELKLLVDEARNQFGQNWKLTDERMVELIEGITDV